MANLEDLIIQGIFDIEINTTNPRTSGYAGIGDGVIAKSLDGGRWMKIGTGDNDWEKIMISDNGLFINKDVYPFTVDFQNGVQQTRNLTTITDSDGYYNTNQPDSIYIGTNVTSIGFQAFSNSNFAGVNLANQSVTIPDSVTTIGSFAFYYSAL